MLRAKSSVIVKSSPPAASGTARPGLEAGQRQRLRPRDQPTDAQAPVRRLDGGLTVVA